MLDPEIVFLVAVLGALLFLVIIKPIAAHVLARKELASAADAKERREILASTFDYTWKVAAGAGVAITVVFAGYTYQTGQETLNATIRGQEDDRYAKAVEKLSSDKEQTQVGGVYELQFLIEDAPSKKEASLATLAAFVRSTEPPAEPVAMPLKPVCDGLPPVRPSAAVEAAMSILTSAPIDDLDLHGAYLAGVQLNGRRFGLKVNLDGADLSGANLSNIVFKGIPSFRKANLMSACLINTRFEGGSFRKADFRYALLFQTTFTHSSLNCATMERADLTGAALRSPAEMNRPPVDVSWLNLRHAVLADTDLRYTILDHVDFTGAEFMRTKIQDADLSAAHGVTESQLQDAVMNENTQLPLGKSTPESPCDE